MGIAFERVVMVMMENSTRDNVLNNGYMSNLRKQGVFLSNSHGVTHPSQPNYIVSISGDTFGFINDDNGWATRIQDDDPNQPPITTIVDLLEAQGLSWKSYAEDLLDSDRIACPAKPPYPEIPDDHFPFARKHVPFLCFPSVASNPDRMAKVVNASEFETDLAAGNLPTYSWYTPNLINCGHSLSSTKNRNHPLTEDAPKNVDNVASFLQGFLGSDPIAKFPAETLIVITWDEAYPYSADYGVYTLLISDMLEAGTTNSEPSNHYTMLRSMEVNFGLGCLNRNDASAQPMWFLR